MTQRITTINEDEIREVYEWVDSFTLSRIKRSISRDVSDAVLLQEILKVYFPSTVVLNTIVQAHSRKDKLVNWDYLRRTVNRQSLSESRVRAD